jgi:hypothetical protein
LIERGITPRMSIKMGELSVRVDGKLLYSYKQSGKDLLSNDELLNLVQPSYEIPLRSRAM